MKYIAIFILITQTVSAQNRDDWKYYKCPDADISKMNLIKYGETKEDVYLGTDTECAEKKAETPDEITCLPLIKDQIINSYLKNKEIYDELHGENTLIVNPTVYSATIEFHAKYLFKRGEAIEPVTFYVFHSPNFCRGGWIDIEKNLDGSMFIQSTSFEHSIYYMWMTTIKKQKEMIHPQQSTTFSVDSSTTKHAVQSNEIALETSGIFTSTSEDDLYKKTHYAIQSSTSATAEFTNNFISQTKNKLPQIVQGNYCISTLDPNVMIFYWAYKSELKFSVFRDIPNAGRKDKRDALNALLNANVIKTDKCNQIKER